MKHYYCSAISGAYCYQGLVLYKSLVRFDPDFTIYFVCLDQLAFEILDKLNLPHIELINIETLEASFPELSAVKPNRALNEYAWTIKPSEMLYIFDIYNEVDRLIWVDSDTEMLGETNVIFDEWAMHSILLTEQYYTDWHESLTATYGRFQAGFVGFLRNAEALRCLQWWQRKCIEWCSSISEEGRWADQKYLDTFPTLCRDAHVARSQGINMTPFILYRLSFEQQKRLEVIGNQYFVEGTRIILYHYYGFRYFDDENIDLCRYWMKFDQNTIKHLYHPYIEACRTAILELEAVKPDYRLQIAYNNRYICNYLNPSRLSAKAAYDAATIASQDTLQEALALYSSFQQHQSSFYWWVCCIDKTSFKKLKALRLSNASVIYIDQVLKDAPDMEVKNGLSSNSLEILKANFLYYLLKNNHSIAKLMYINSDFYFFTSLDTAASQLDGYEAFLLRSGKKNSSSNLTDYEKDFFGLANCKDTIEFLEACTELPKGPFCLIEKVIRNIKANTIDRLEFCSTYEDLKYNKISMREGSISVNGCIIKAFHFSDNDRLMPGSIRISKKARMYLDKHIYNNIYSRYEKELNKARLKLSQESFSPIVISGGKEMNFKGGRFNNSIVLITGANGFIGSHIVQRMVKEGAKVSIIVREDSDLWRIESLLPYIHVIRCDLKNDELVQKAVTSIKPEYIFHMAAYGVDFRQQNYAEAAKSNILGTINLLEAVRKAGGCSKFLYSGTSMQYGNKEGIITEEMQLKPANIYGSTKASATLIAHQIAGENNIPITTLIPFGVFGENEGSHKFFPHIILSIIDKRDVDLTMCEQYRDYCYIENIVDGFLLAALDKKHSNEIFNIGSGKVNQLKYYVDLIFKNMNTEQKPNYGALEYRKNDLWCPQPAVNKITTMLGWNPGIKLEEGLQRTIKWYTENYHRYKEKRR